MTPCSAARKECAGSCSDLYQGRLKWNYPDAPCLFIDPVGLCGQADVLLRLGCDPRLGLEESGPLTGHQVAAMQQRWGISVLGCDSPHTWRFPGQLSTVN